MDQWWISGSFIIPEELHCTLDMKFLSLKKSSLLKSTYIPMDTRHPLLLFWV